MTSKVYETPRTRVRVGLLALSIRYALAPSLVTSKNVSSSPTVKGSPDALTNKLPLIVVLVFTTRPVFGAIDAVTEPDAILGASSESAEIGMLLSCEPSPANEPENEPLNTA